MKSDRRKVVITRAVGQAQMFRDFIFSDNAKLKFDDFFIEPILSINYFSADFLNFKSYDGVFLTSVHAVHVLPLCPDDHVPSFYCVGQATAQALYDKGYNVHAVYASVRDMVSALAQFSPASFLYVRGRDVTMDIGSALLSNGGLVDEVEVYSADFVPSFSADFLTMLSEGKIGAVTFFSRRTALHFANMIDTYNLGASVRGIKALCISDAVVECLHSCFDDSVSVADTPDAIGMKNAVLRYCAL